MLVSARIELVFFLVAGTVQCFGFSSVLVSAGTELTLFLVARTVLCFGFSVRIMVITH